jgi:hypothetical protein
VPSQRGSARVYYTDADTALARSRVRQWCRTTNISTNNSVQRLALSPSQPSRDHALADVSDSKSTHAQELHTKSSHTQRLIDTTPHKQNKQNQQNQQNQRNAMQTTRRIHRSWQSPVSFEFTFYKCECTNSFGATLTPHSSSNERRSRKTSSAGVINDRALRACDRRQHQRIRPRDQETKESIHDPLRSLTRRRFSCRPCSCG